MDSHVEVTVSDTGIGISPEFLPHVFERFRQADAGTTRERGGLGLGLSIARQLTEMHGGTIEASSGGLGQGSTFRVKIPLMIVHPVPGNAAARASAIGRQTPERFRSRICAVYTCSPWTTSQMRCRWWPKCSRPRVRA